MLYEIFNSLKEAHGQDYFTSRVSDEIINNLNPKFELREYQKEALGRFDFYFTEYQKRQWPAHLLFHMATGSGKTLIMAANVLYLYKKGYRNFLFFVNNLNIIEKTKDNFLNPASDKYLFAPKIKFDDREVLIKEVQNFDGVNQDDINIVFTTIQGLHIRIIQPRENVITEEDFEGKDIVLISDEAHHLQTVTRNNLNEQELERSWEYTIIQRIFKKNPRNILLEFTATIDLNNSDIKNKYEDKIIFQYDLKQFRLDGYSKEIEVIQADLNPLDRMILAIIISQYKRKIAEKNGIYLKPVILFKSKSIKESEENYNKFLEKIRDLTSKDINELKKIAGSTYFEKAFNYFEQEKITDENLIRELRIDFNENTCMLLDSENIDTDKQLKLNSLENKKNEIRAIFAVNMLNEGWDVLNLFDIVRLYDTRDGKTRRDGTYVPGNTTMSEAQLIGRGARYFPFVVNNYNDLYKRKFDDDIENELRIIETLHYHCKHNPKYIYEIKQTLTKIGILPEQEIQYDLFIKPEIKNKDIWKKGLIFLNERKERNRTNILSFQDININQEYFYEFPSGKITESILFNEENDLTNSEVKIIEKKIRLLDFGKNVVRFALDKFDFFYYKNLIKYFPNLKSREEFIESPNYLGSINIIVKGPNYLVNSLKSTTKLEVIYKVLKEISEMTSKIGSSNFIGTREFMPINLNEVIRDKKVKYSPKQDEKFDKFYFNNLDWFAQKEFYGTEEEKKFLEFISNFINRLKKKYKEVFLFRNERFFKIYNFDDGEAFEPDFVLFLIEKTDKSKKSYKSSKEKIISYQIFIEPKGSQFFDSNGTFKNSKEGWKEELLLKLKDEAKIPLVYENKAYKLLGCPFYNEALSTSFREYLEKNLGI